MSAGDKREAPAVLRPLLPALLALFGIILLLNLISFAFGQAPLTTLRLALAGTWGTPYGVGQVLFKSTPLIFTALAFEVAMRSGLFNIGAEGRSRSAASRAASSARTSRRARRGPSPSPSPSPPPRSPAPASRSSPR